MVNCQEFTGHVERHGKSWITSLISFYHLQHYFDININVCLRSYDQNFDMLLEKMMEIIMENSGAEAGAIINKDPQAGYTIIAYSSQSTGCITTPKLLDEDEDRIALSVVNYVIHTKEGILIPNAKMDARFATGRWFSKTGPKSVICLPILHKSFLVGIIYIQANIGVFSTRHVTVMTILCQQFGISVSNALLYKSIQKTTMENLQMIEKQKHALIEARQSKEAVEKAMRLKGYFLANMCKSVFRAINVRG